MTVFNQPLTTPLMPLTRPPQLIKATHRQGELYLPFLYHTRTILQHPIYPAQRRQYLSSELPAERTQPRYHWSESERFKTTRREDDGEEHRGLRIHRWRGRHKDERQADPAYRQRLQDDRLSRQDRLQRPEDHDYGSVEEGYAREEDDFEDYTPFERDSPVHAPRESTITATERAIFARMFSQMGTDVALESKEEGTEIKADEDLDTILETAIKRAAASPTRKGSVATALFRYPASLQDLAASAHERLREKQERQAELQEAAIKIGAPGKEALRIEGLLHAAKTDVELWQILETEVFGPMKALNLDGNSSTEFGFPEKKTRKVRRKKGDPAQEPTLDPTTPSKSDVEAQLPDFSIIGPVYPSSLLLALRILRSSFPHSTLALSILPAIKAVGPSSYALGATTQLYNELISIRWLTYSDFHSIDELLQEMDNGGIYMDGDTLGLLEAIYLDSRRIADGRFGKAVRLVWGMDRMRTGLKELRWWRETVRKRLEDRALEEAREKEDREREGSEELLLGYGGQAQMATA